MIGVEQSLGLGPVLVVVGLAVGVHNWRRWLQARRQRRTTAARVDRLLPGG